MFQQYKEKRALRKINDFQFIDGWLTSQEALGLYLTAGKLRRNATVVEIGSWQGKSTFCLAKGLSSGKVHAIDPFNASGGDDTESEKLYTEKKGGNDLLAQFSSNMEKLGVLEKIIIKKGYSDQFHGDFDKIDLLFIDGDHSINGCSADFEYYAHKVVPGGFLAFHDYYEDHNELGPTHVIKNKVLPSGEYKFYRQYHSLWIAQKVG